MWLLAASIPLSAMTAPMTAVMKALDGVRAALACDLAWAFVYLAMMLALAGPLGVAGAGVAQLAACVVQLGLAARLAPVRPRVTDALGVFAKTLVCAAIAFAPVLIAYRLSLPRVVVWTLGLAAVFLYLRVARWLGVFSAEERARLARAVEGHGLARAVSGWMP